MGAARPTDPLRTIFRSTSLSRKRQLYFLCFMVTAGALAELTTIAAVVPFVSLLAGTGASKLSIFRDFLNGFGSPQESLNICDRLVQLENGTIAEAVDDAVRRLVRSAV